MTSHIILVFLFTMFCSSLAVAQDDKTNSSFDPTGNYHPVNPPVGPDKGVQFNLRISKFGDRWQGIGEVRGTGSWYRFSTTSIDRGGMRFVTSTRSRVRYEFRGEFLKRGVFARQWTGKGLIALKGKLSKYVSGKRSWEIETPFAYYPPH